MHPGCMYADARQALLSLHQLYALQRVCSVLFGVYRLLQAPGLDLSNADARLTHTYRHMHRLQ